MISQRRYIRRMILREIASRHNDYMYTELEDYISNSNFWLHNNNPYSTDYNNIKESDGKIIDAQIDQMFKVVSRMSGDTLNESKDERVYRYVYSDKYLTDIRHKDVKWVKYKNIYDNLWRKEVFLVNHKHRKMGLHRIKRVSKEI